MQQVTIDLFNQKFAIRLRDFHLQHADDTTLDVDNFLRLFRMREEFANTAFFQFKSKAVFL